MSISFLSMLTSFFSLINLYVRHHSKLVTLLRSNKSKQQEHQCWDRRLSCLYLKGLVQKGHILLFGPIFIFCRIKLIFGRLTCFDMKRSGWDVKVWSTSSWAAKFWVLRGKYLDSCHENKPKGEARCAAQHCLKISGEKDWAKQEEI